jgi:hypothetical protein
MVALTVPEFYARPETMRSMSHVNTGLPSDITLRGLIGGGTDEWGCSVLINTGWSGCHGHISHYLGSCEIWSIPWVI